MRDIRLLTLYKQHYLDEYDASLECQYSCLGYYDGIDIKEVENKQYSQLFQKQTESPISELWFESGEVTSQLNGGYSCQNIGLLRCVSTMNKMQIYNKEIFWENAEDEPFFAVAFLKLENGQEYELVGRNIEALSEDNNEKIQKNCRILTYCTYDNADLVVLMHGNSVVRILEKMEQIEEMQEVIYLHSILGFSEKYLQECKSNNRILEYFKGRRCFIYSDIVTLNIRFVTNNKKDLLKKLREELGKWNNKPEHDFHIKGYEDIRYSYILGHENIEMNFSETSVQTIITLLLPEGFITHQNSLYKNYIYNIETFLQIKKEVYKDADEKEKQESEKVKSEKREGELIKNKSEIKGGKKEKSWCKSLIQEYRTKMNEALDSGDESLYSHFQALIHTLNMLDQYERFSMSKEMFYLLYPALNMFIKQLTDALNQEDENYEYHIERVKNSLGQMVEYVNSVIYHTVHTDQVYLMIPGYSGSSFSIPIKLNLLYLWFIDLITQALNDSNNKYNSILIPVSESRPMTSFLPFAVQERNRLICVKISQRFLYMPRALVIFLSHELAHYIGDTIRNRELRLKLLVCSLSYFIAEGIYKEDDIGSDDQNSVSRWVKQTRENLMNRFIQYVEEERWGNKTDESYYGETIKVFLKDSIKSFLSSDDEAVEIIQEVPDIFGSTQEFLNGMSAIYREQEIMDRNRKRMLASGLIDRFVDTLVILFQEVFCDTVAASMLGFKLEDYEEAFQVSEGKPTSTNFNLVPQQWRIRREVMENILSVKVEESDTEQIQNREVAFRYKREKYRDGEELETYLLSNMANFLWIKVHLIQYAEHCKSDIEVHLGSNKKVDTLNGKTVAEVVKEIKEAFMLFTKNDKECYYIYGKINKYIYDYMERVEQQWESDSK